MRIAVLLWSVVVLNGCALDQPPPVSDLRSEAMPGLALDRPWSAQGGAAGAVRDDWLATFNDPQLQDLVREAIAANPDLRAAAAGVERSAATLEKSRAALYPAVSLLGRGGLKAGDDVMSGLSFGALSVSWEIDLWGRVRYARNAAEAMAASSASDFEFRVQSLAAQVARSWFTATETLLLQRLGEQMVLLAEQQVGLAERRQQVGAGSEKEVAIARANAGSYRDGVEQARLAHVRALRALELLLARYPAAELQARVELPALPGPVPAGMPLEMLDRRPDLVAAERRVAAAFNLVGEARAARLPRLALSANLGVLSSQILKLKDDFRNPTGGVGGMLVAPIYQGGALDAQVAISKADQKQAVAEYASLALQALGEVEDSLTASVRLAERERILQETVSQNSRAMDLEQVAYREGKTDLRSVVQQQLALSSSRTLLIRVQSERLIERVHLHLTLGGSFRAPPPAPEKP